LYVFTLGNAGMQLNSYGATGAKELRSTEQCMNSIQRKSLRISLTGEGRIVVGSIWNIGAGDQSSRPVRNANSGP